MLDFPRWKVWLTIVTVVIGVALALPSLLPEGVRQVLPARYAATRINLGLDLKGGMHLIMKVVTDDALRATVSDGVSLASSELGSAGMPGARVMAFSLRPSAAFARGLFSVPTRVVGPGARPAVRGRTGAHYSRFSTAGAVAGGRRRIIARRRTFDLAAFRKSA